MEAMETPIFCRNCSFHEKNEFPFCKLGSEKLEECWKRYCLKVVDNMIEDLMKSWKKGGSKKGNDINNKTLQKPID